MKKIIISSFTLAMVFSFGLMAKAEVVSNLPLLTKEAVKAEVINSTPVSIDRVLVVGSRGEDVKALQKILKKRGFFSANTTGYFGTQTQTAVKKYQKDANFIKTTGKVDARTLEVMKGEQAISVEAIAHQGVSEPAPIISTKDISVPPSVSGQDNIKPEIISVPNTNIINTINTNDITIDQKPVIVIDANDIPSTNDTNPRIMYWWGKVNQHIDLSTGKWMTDPDGISGANLDKLAYCQKWFPKTINVEDYKIESIGTWQDRGNVSAYKSFKMSTKCIQGTGINVDNLPDLIVSDFSWNPGNPVVSLPTGFLDMKVTVKNIGNTSVNLPENMQINLYKDKIASGGIALGTAPYTLNPGDSTIFTFTTAVQPNILERPGVFTLTMVVDDINPNTSNGLVKESNEKNNFLDKIINIGSTTPLTSSLAVISPNGGETFANGSTQTITWQDNIKSASMMPTYYDINLVFYRIPCLTERCPRIAERAPLVVAQKVSGYSYSWPISGVINTGASYMSIPDGKYTIQICKSGSDICDSSDNYFTINSQQTNQYITLISPLNQATWTGGNPYTISWKSGTGKVTLLACGTLFTNTKFSPKKCATLAVDQPSSGSYVYNLPYGTTTSSYDIEIQVKDLNNTDSHIISSNNTTLSALLGEQG